MPSKNRRKNIKHQNEENLQEITSVITIEKQINAIKLKTQKQKDLVEAIKNNDIIIGSGPAGTGKTFVSLWTTLSMINKPDFTYDKIILMKPYVEAGEKLGFLPGNVKQKMDPYLLSYYWNLDQLVGETFSKKLVDRKQIEFFPLGMIRGITFKNCIIILDEAQNTSPEQMKTFITRMGENSKIIILGDEKQSDVKQSKSGLTDIKEKINGLHNIQIINFENSDVIRHDLVRKILDRYDSCEFLEKNGEV